MKNLKKAITGYRFVKFKEYKNKTITLDHITLQETGSGEFLNILYGYDVDTKYIRNYFVGKNAGHFLTDILTINGN